MTVFALVASLGLAMPVLFSGLASAERNVTENLTVHCDALGATDYNVVATDHDPGRTLPTMQDKDSSLVFVPIYGTLKSIYTAKNPTDPRLAEQGKPASFPIAPGEPYSYHKGIFRRGNLQAKRTGQNLITCTITDDSDVNNDIGDADNNSLFVTGLEYHYTDVFTMQTLVTRKRSATVQAANVDDGKQSIEGQHKQKHKKGGTNRGPGKRGR